MISDKLKRLEDNLRSLTYIRQNYTVDDIINDKVNEWALRYGLFESIQIIIDLACSIVTQKNLGIPKNYSDCIQFLINNKYLDLELGEGIKSMVGLRNLLVHEYGIIDVKKLYEYLNRLNDIREFGIAISRF
jgi:uncharacterized protein YutE (UPF0331/DUF86 family)